MKEPEPGLQSPMQSVTLSYGPPHWLVVCRTERVGFPSFSSPTWPCREPRDPPIELFMAPFSTYPSLWGTQPSVCQALPVAVTLNFSYPRLLAVPLVSSDLTPTQLSDPRFLLLSVLFPVSLQCMVQRWARRRYWQIPDEGRAGFVGV